MRMLGLLETSEGSKEWEVERRTEWDEAKSGTRGRRGPWTESRSSVDDVAAGRVRRVHTPLEPVVLAATLLLIPVLILEADADGGWLTFATPANWVIWDLFAAELVAVLLRRAATKSGASSALAGRGDRVAHRPVCQCGAWLGVVSHGSSGCFGSERSSGEHFRPRSG